MDPTNMLFEAVIQATGGIINDLYTAMLAVVFLFALFLGFDLLMNVFRDRADFNNSPSYYDLVQLKENSKRYAGTVRGDFFSREYRRKMRSFRGRDLESYSDE